MKLQYGIVVNVVIDISRSKGGGGGGATMTNKTNKNRKKTIFSAVKDLLPFGGIQEHA